MCTWWINKSIFRAKQTAKATFLPDGQCEWTVLTNSVYWSAESDYNWWPSRSCVPTASHSEVHTQPQSHSMPIFLLKCSKFLFFCFFCSNTASWERPVERAFLSGRSTWWLIVHKIWLVRWEYCWLAEQFGIIWILTEFLPFCVPLCLPKQLL